MTVEWCAQAFLIEMVTNEANATSKDEQAVQAPDPNILVGFFPGKCTGISEQVDKADGNATVDVQDERILLRCRHLLDGECVIEKGVAREVLLHVLLDQLDSKIRIIHRLDLVANTTDWELVREASSQLSVTHFSQ